MTRASCFGKSGSAASQTDRRLAWVNFQRPGRGFPSPDLFFFNVFLKPFGLSEGLFWDCFFFFFSRCYRYFLDLAKAVVFFL